MAITATTAVSNYFLKRKLHFQSYHICVQRYKSFQKSNINNLDVLINRQDISTFLWKKLLYRMK